MFRRQNDVFVVWEDNHIFGRHFFNCLHNVFRAWVHCLAAFNNFINCQILKQVCKAFARCNRNHANFFGFNRLLASCQKFAVFFAHIFNFQAVKFAKFKGISQRKVWFICMHMHFHKLQVANTNHAVANGHQFFTKFVNIGGCGFFVKVNNHIFGAISKLDFAQVVDIWKNFVHCFCGGNGLFINQFNFFADKPLIKSVQNHQKAFAATVHNARLFQNRQHFGGLRQNDFPLFQHKWHKGVEIVCVFGNLNGLFGNHADNGEDCAFFWLCYGLIGNI